MNRKLARVVVDLLLLRHVTRFFTNLRKRRNKRDGGQDSDGASRQKPSSRPGSHSADFWPHVGKNLLIGLVIAAGLHFAHGLHLPTLIAAEDAAMDFVMRQFRNIALQEENTALVLLEVDQATYEMWGQPFYFHRNRVQRLIEHAVAGNPALIVVDIELNKRVVDDGSDDLMRYLGRYSTQQNPPLILMRTLSNWPDDVPSGQPRAVQASFLEPVVQDAENVFWASPLFQLDDDHRIRRWWLWHGTCTEGQASVLPSVQLLSQLLLDRTDGRTNSEKYASLIAELEQIGPRCGADNSKSSLQSDHPHSGGPATIEIRGHRVELRDSLSSQRLIYTIPYDDEGVIPPEVILDDRSVPVFERSSAHRIEQMNPDFMKGRVIVIGGTYRETRDWHLTPIGEMPGAMVLVNAIHSIGTNGQLQTPSLWVKLAIEACLIVIMSLVFARVSSFLGYVLCSALVLLALVPISFVMFRAGVWVDFALPLLAVQLHEFAAEFEAVGKEAQNRRTKKRKKLTADEGTDTSKADLQAPAAAMDAATTGGRPVDHKGPQQHRAEGGEGAS